MPSNDPETPLRRPSHFEERAALALFMAFSPRLGRTRVTVPPDSLKPFDIFEIQRSDKGPLPATFFASADAARGAVLFVHPWVPWGQAYFHRNGRIEAVRAAGYHAMTFDLSGFGNTAQPRRFFDLD